MSLHLLTKMSIQDEAKNGEPLAGTYRLVFKNGGI